MTHAVRRRFGAIIRLAQTRHHHRHPRSPPPPACPTRNVPYHVWGASSRLVKKYLLLPACLRSLLGCLLLLLRSYFLRSAGTRHSERVGP
eukprot:307041-Rhodomonas_salina.1